MEPSTELENLEKDNASRIDALLKSGVQLQPGTFELVQITTYLEYLIDALADGCLEDARMKFADKCSDLVTQLETMSRRAKIVNGNFPGQKPSA